MEPLHPDLRIALKEAHPSLTDEDIDQSEELLAERMSHDPVEEPERIAQLDAERMEFIRQKMPRYTEIVQVFNARQRTSFDQDRDRVRVTVKRPARD